MGGQVRPGLPTPRSVDLSGTVNFLSPWVENRRAGVFGTLSATLLGLLFCITPLGLGLHSLSYDIPFFFRPNLTRTNAVVVYMDKESHDRLGQPPLQEWHRVLHAELLKELDKGGAHTVVFDILIDAHWTNKMISPSPVALGFLTNRSGYTPGDLTGPAVDQILSRAVRDARCNVVFGAKWEQKGREHGTLKAPDRILEGISTNQYGTVGFPQTTGTVVREHSWDENPPSLAWRIAHLTGQAPPDPTARRWINYYGPPKTTIPHTSYIKVFEERGVRPDFFKDKVVFVGKEPVLTGGGTAVSDELPTPYTMWKHRLTPGVEIQATAFLNLYHKEWLRLASFWTELLILVLSGCVMGYGLPLLRPWVATRVAVLSSLFILVAACWLAWTFHYWFDWMIIVVVQIPVAWTWAVMITTKRLYREKAVLEESLATARSRGLTPVMNSALDKATVVSPPWPGQAEAPPFQEGLPPQPGQPLAPPIPDHTLLKCVGKGAYGEVWLARDIIGSFHAVKVVYRRSFSSDSPYLREFRGIEKFTPVSRLHPGLVQILHVGRNQAGGYFFCIMEAGDDEKLGPQIDPQTYVPRNLARELEARGRLPVAECVALGVALGDALQFLHDRKLIHRDIKPSNIIYAQGLPKFADIGLVTDLVTRDRDVSFLGTEGFIAPEGPGTAAADVYSLGKLLYEAGMGRDRQQFPELPTHLDQWPDQKQLLQLNRILLKACETDVANRYQTAAALRADLAALQLQLSETGHRPQ